MGKSLVGGTIVGGIIVFVWMMVSWMFLPWHCETTSKFTDESAVATVILENTEKDGVYFLPRMCGQSKEDMAERSEAMEKGPVVFATVQRYGFDSTSLAPFIVGFIIQLIGAFLITLILLQTTGLAYWNKVFIVTLIGLVIGVLGVLPNWNWMGYTLAFSGVLILDYIIGWFLAGLAISGFARK